MVGAMAVTSYVSGTDPHLTDIPYVNFPRFIVEQILQGVMMEPLEKASKMLTPELKKEISHVVSIVGGRDQHIKESRMKVESHIRELEFDIDE